jgi:hypothetical protein
MSTLLCECHGNCNKTIEAPFGTMRLLHERYDGKYRKTGGMFHATRVWRIGHPDCLDKSGEVLETNPNFVVYREAVK